MEWNIHHILYTVSLPTQYAVFYKSPYPITWRRVSCRRHCNFRLIGTFARNKVTQELCRKGMYCNLDSQPCSHCQMFTTTTAQRVMVSYCFALCLYVYSSTTTLYYWGSYTKAAGPIQLSFLLRHLSALSLFSALLMSSRLLENKMDLHASRRLWEVTLHVRFVGRGQWPTKAGDICVGLACCNVIELGCMHCIAFVVSQRAGQVEHCLCLWLARWRSPLHCGLSLCWR